MTANGESNEFVPNDGRTLLGDPTGPPDDGIPPALAARLERIEASLTWLCGLAESAQEALAKLEGHPMLGKLFNGQTGGVSNGHGG